MALKVKLVKSAAGASERQLRTLRGLGLSKFGQERLLKDTPAIRGMAFALQHLVSAETVSGEAKGRSRRKPRKIVQRDRALAKKGQSTQA
jgi:large subunit ribosomal protein L30